ncbi:hypothetical protein BJV85_002077 [Clostridium acetobutylicum]|uniref:Uncharacterized protein n=1 Tax=Clostridium acetobutylicum (strain ATCC 824 / DSM 792 / JCM 1419 / IAM 19013 / LMG 5710 / NBRC 13948 / NRRL B-527 / VKM B-1787 / 2291 / W) TaxID=272562 RepID=Q97HU1_CLOAB|nr:MULTISPECIES: hypothetical protein [Clostridium]AAK79879.1 Hypothetical protein CA_C1916 [Clostridium acetobutylicum ATCC 824]ADZ20968.1 Conserved hypothetical protein [Clostridium acetobutylicum EA 2018]AEI32056.1 hypothetical protein SMB_G1944 [Clostridium acetobutylicum DSM 1731]AWV79690.1 hypothetical protein DK921_06165 [Clostridium acetobutylicum]MBC2394334.1 hypothetical protein [Clostridium acetobutylicum]
MQVRIIKATPGIPLELKKEYKVNFETENHYIIFNSGIWCGIYKTDAEIINFKELESGQLVLNI